jgi:hypothetical protein
VTEIRSYSTVFDLERRVYRVDRLRLNPGGVPVRAFVYLVACIGAGALAAKMPLLGRLTSLVPWYLRELAAPAAIAAVLTGIRIEGRPFHLAALALLCMWTRPSQGGLTTARGRRRRWRPPDIIFLPDGTDYRMRALRYAGPGVAVIAIEHQSLVSPRRRTAMGWRGVRRGALGLSEAGGGRPLARRQAVELGRGARMIVRAHSHPAR